jgi:hypothetical protein
MRWGELLKKDRQNYPDFTPLITGFHRFLMETFPFFLYNRSLSCAIFLLETFSLSILFKKGEAKKLSEGSQKYTDLCLLSWKQVQRFF